MEEPDFVDATDDMGRMKRGTRIWKWRRRARSWRKATEKKRTTGKK
jgi:hypothetical protein